MICRFKPLQSKRMCDIIELTGEEVEEMAENEKSRCGDTVTEGQWSNLWPIERQLQQRGRLECALASALNIIATLYYSMLTNGHDDELAKVQSDPMIVRDVRRLEGICL